MGGPGTVADMTTTLSGTADNRQPKRSSATSLLTTILARSSDGMIAAGCVFGVVSPSILLTRHCASSTSRPDGRWTR